VGNLMLYVAGDRIHVYDVAKGYDLKHLQVPRGSLLFNGPGRVFFAAPKKGIWCVRPNYAALPEMREAMDLRISPRLLMAGGSLIFFCVALFAVSWAFIVPGRRRVPSTHETTVRAGVLVTITAIAGLVCAYSGAIAIRYILFRDISWLGSLYGCLLVLPPVIMMGSFLFCALAAARPVRNTSLRPSNDPWVKATAKRICEEMAVPYRVAVMSSTSPGISPYVAKHLGRRYSLVVPSNLRVLVRDACEGDPHRAEGLLRLVLAHEIAHIKNRDLSVLPLVWAVRHPLKWWFIAMVTTYYMARYGFADPLVLLIGGPLTGPLIASAVVITAAFHSLLRHRERLADATATLYVTPDMVKTLTSRDSSGLAVVEKLILAFSAPPLLHKSYLGFDIGTQTTIASSHGRYAFLVPFRRQVSLFRREVTRRLKNLATKTFVVAHAYRPSLGAAAFSAVMMGIILLFLRALKVATFSDYLLATLPDGPVDEWFGYLQGMNTQRGLAALGRNQKSEGILATW